MSTPKRSAIRFEDMSVDPSDTVTFERAGMGNSSAICVTLNVLRTGDPVYLDPSQTLKLIEWLCGIADLESPVSSDPMPGLALPVADPTQALLWRAFKALSETPNSMAVEQTRLRLATEIAKHLLSERFTA